ncbi:oxidoreductase [Actinophytocola xinjiangensis]|uniref:Oxidoreductase n=1 Tax=Actinophytocola xinjiangensis TaxID=485602 RepID=A0A7Z0WGQ6_9PSEU|nr:aldo/keto reductase [Actinophytocola xinjiangensis]OLF06839.1 oxidoreductase [Actinophytocola xinjiangensis]
MNSGHIPTVELNNGVAMPRLGFGVFQVPNEETEAAVSEALRAGYRAIDTAKAYGNEPGVASALRASGVAREDLFVTTKLWNNDHGHDRALHAFDTSLRLLGLDYLDLYLIHWPAPSSDRYVETWRALVSLLAGGRVRAVGVSNFQPAHLRRIVAETGTVPSVNQVELHPYLQQAELRELHAELGVVTEAWSPLAKGGELLADPVVGEVARRHARTPAQVVLRWHLQLGNVVIPKSVTPARIRENLDVFGFALGEDDMAAIGTLDQGLRTGPDPDHFG